MELIMDEQSRRKFLKYGLASLGAFLGSAAVLTIDKATGFKIGEHKYGIGMSEANATCGSAFGCSGGGGKCGSAFECSGGGEDSSGSGHCGSAFGCSGGGGKCGSAFECSGQ